MGRANDSAGLGVNCKTHPGERERERETSLWIILSPSSNIEPAVSQQQHSQTKVLYWLTADRVSLCGELLL